jgi:hypothetical protein
LAAILARISAPLLVRREDLGELRARIAELRATGGTMKRELNEHSSVEYETGRITAEQPSGQF